MNVLDLLPISVATLSTSSLIQADLYCRGEDSEAATLYRAAEIAIRDEDLTRLRDRGVTQLYIQPEDRAAYQSYLRELANEEGPNPSSSAQHAAVLNEVVLDVLETSFDGGTIDDAVGATRQLSKMAANLVTRADFAAPDLFRVLHHDYATFTHSANVAFYSGVLARALAFTDDDIEQIIAGGLLHDLGKLQIDDAILTKPSKLDDLEFHAIKKHPLRGFQQLARREDLSWGQLMMAYQHHERLDGGGYPVGVTEDAIHPWAKLCAVVDIYEAVTSHRPYRKPMPREQALSILSRESGKALDPEMVQCWISVIQNTTPT
ncbi:MAG: HD-GYP domain-containing protein [Planctomycetota bacterium]